MKPLIIPTFIVLFCTTIAFANNVSIEIKMQSAKQAYNTMTKVPPEGAAGHFIKQGHNINCQYINAPMDGPHGKPVPQNDPLRYSCIIIVNETGIAAATPKAL